MKRVQRFDVVLVTLDPTVGAEIRKTRQCVVVSPNDLNRALKTIIFAPMTSTVWNAPFRIPVHFRDRAGSITLNQIRTVDMTRVVRRLGELDAPTSQAVSDRLVDMFSL